MYDYESERAQFQRLRELGFCRKIEKGVEKMILIAVVAELLEEYTLLVASVLQHLLSDAPFPRRMRFLMLRSIPFSSGPPAVR